MERLSQAAAGLLFMSESDYPFELIQWDGPTEPTADFIRNVAVKQKTARSRSLK